MVEARTPPPRPARVEVGDATSDRDPACRSTVPVLDG
jgi:hypothetical protein